MNGAGPWDRGLLLRLDPTQGIGRSEDGNVLKEARLAAGNVGKGVGNGVIQGGRWLADGAAETLYRTGEWMLDASGQRMYVVPPSRIGGNGGFGGIVGQTPAESAFLRNAAATFDEGSVFSTAMRLDGNIIIQRSDIPWSSQNATRMAGGNAPFVKNAQGEWERVNLHHVGRQDGQLIEVLESHNTYNPRTGGPLHIPGPGSPVRDPMFNRNYWQLRLQQAIEQGLVSPEVLKKAGLR